jgi:methanogenic corrinoid protein MtbC1
MGERALCTAASAAGKLSIGALSRASGVPAETLRTWEQRYGFPAAERKPSGHRLYPAGMVARVRRIADAIAAGHRASAVVAATDAELNRLLSATALQTAPAPLPVSPSTESLDDLMAAVSAFDTDRLTAALWSDWGRLGPTEFLQATAAPLVERVGQAWAEGRMEIRHEHFLSERLADVMRAIRLPLDHRASGPVVVCATLPGELHALGLQMAALALAAAGLRVVYLGTEVPPVELARVARDLGARAVAVSVSAASDRDGVKRHLGRLREALPRSVVMLLGGQGAPPGRANAAAVADFAGLEHWARELRARPAPLLQARGRR